MYNILYIDILAKRPVLTCLYLQVWWEAVPMRLKVIGYEVFYSMADVDDLDMWQRKTVGLVTSIDLVNLERHAQVSRVDSRLLVRTFNIFCI